MAFLPTDYTPPSKESNFFKPKAGENKVRIMSSAVVGYQYWTNDDKPLPVRVRELPEHTPENIRIKEDGKIDQPKHFWGCVVWDYGDSRIKTWQITQASIRDAIQGLIMDEAWGDPKQYDLKIVRTGEKLDTNYSVIPRPKTEITQEMAQSFAEADIDLNMLYTNEEDQADYSHINVE